jgi:8-oxo-dGTP pyrophosphatase MutT (NUDIX family)
VNPSPSRSSSLAGSTQGSHRVVQAAGGLVVRDGLVLVVHRPRYDDWSLPKGKLDPGESLEECARREVWEETGFEAVTERFLGIVRYTDRKDRPKEVHYWLMSIASGEFAANDEVDSIMWLTPDETVAQLSYLRDGDVLSMAGLIDGPTGDLTQEQS